MAQEHSEFREVEFRYGFSFPWFMLPSEVQQAIDELEHSLEVHDLMDDCHLAYLQSLMEVRYESLGLLISREIAERYDLALPEYYR